MTNIASLPGKVEGYGLVRDCEGKPVIQDIDHIPMPIWNMLTQTEQAEIISVRHSQRSG